MRLSVVHDQEGNILAASWVVEGGDELEAGEGETVAEFDPPEDMARRLEAGEGSVEDLAKALVGLDQLRVDVGANTLRQL